MPQPLTIEKLAKHIIEVGTGRCNKPGVYCYPSMCPIESICLDINKLDWAVKQLSDDELSRGRCSSIW